MQAFHPPRSDDHALNRKYVDRTDFLLLLLHAGLGLGSSSEHAVSPTWKHLILACTGIVCTLAWH